MIYAPSVKLQELAPGLWRWTAPHPDWQPPKEPDSPADWEQDVGCVAHNAADALVLIDPLVVDGQYEQLDDLARSKARVAILTTLKWHRRSREALAARYDATTSRHEDLRSTLRERLLDLPIEMVLVSHGEPVLREARKALERALSP
jgi:hypothetical protein